MKHVLLSVEDVSKSFGSREILTNINFEINRGDILGFLGFSGSGKTTLLNILSGFLKPSSGHVFYNFSNNTHDFKSIYLESLEFKSIIGFSSQKPSFYPELSIYENMKYFGVLSDMKKETLNKRINEVLDLLDLLKFKKVLGVNLSQGMKKRLDLACALVHDPKILILDEPTSNLDFKLRNEILHYVKKINKTNGITILFVTHFLDEIEEVCNKVLMINYSCKMIDNISNLKQKFDHFIKDEQKHYELNPTNVSEAKNE